MTRSVALVPLAWDIAADIYLPPDSDQEETYAAIVSTHPIGSFTEQTPGKVYGQALTEAGFVVCAFDASFQGASGGEPRFIEDPTMRVKDASSVISRRGRRPPRRPRSAQSDRPR